MRIFALAIAWVALVFSQISEAQIMGPQYVINVGGLPMSCTTNIGVQVGIYSDPSLANIGIATKAPNGAPIIVLNPNVVAQYSPSAIGFS